MSSERWLYLERDICREYKEGNYNSVVEYARENQWNLISKWLSGERGEIKKSLKMGSLLLKRFETVAIKEALLRSVFAVGTLMGTVQSFEHLLHDGSQEARVEEKLLPLAKSVKNLDRIVSVLELHGIMNHTEICEELDLKESTLTEIMKKIGDFHLIASSRVGKYKLYTLTDDGKRLAKQLRMERQEDFDEKELLKKVEFCLRNSKNKEQIRERIQGLIHPENRKGRIYVSPGDTVAMNTGSQKQYYQILMVGLLDENDDQSGGIRYMGGKKLDVEKVQLDELVREEIS